MKFIGKNIENERIKNELSQGDLAEMLCVSESCINDIEKGDTVPHLEQLFEIAEFLNTEAWKLLKEKI